MLTELINSRRKKRQRLKIKLFSCIYYQDLYTTIELQEFYSYSNHNYETHTSKLILLVNRCYLSSYSKGQAATLSFAFRLKDLQTRKINARCPVPRRLGHYLGSGHTWAMPAMLSAVTAQCHGKGFRNPRKNPASAACTHPECTVVHTNL